MYSCGFINLEKWEIFVSVLYNKKEQKSKIRHIFKHFDPHNKNQLNLFGFLDACDLILYIRDFRLAICCELKCWISFRAFCNDILKLKTIMTSIWFEIFIFILVLINLGIYIIYIYIYNISCDHNVLFCH